MKDGHYIAECKHGVVVAQCRCASVDKQRVIVACPPTCRAANVVQQVAEDRVKYGKGPKLVKDDDGS